MLLALLAWVWVAGSALARDRPASERFAVGALAACGLAWTAMVAGALGVGLLGSTPGDGRVWRWRRRPSAWRCDRPCGRRGRRSPRSSRAAWRGWC